MALVVDRFEFLAREIISTLTSARDVLAAIGTFYAVSKSISVLCRLLSTLKTYVIAPSWRTDLTQRYGQWAVVTGSTHGIGKAFSQELASHGMNILIISIGDDDCQRACSFLEGAFHVKTEFVSVDFNDGATAYDKIRPHLEHKDIGILVNNVGVMYDYPQYFLDVTADKLWQLVHVNVAAATMMTYMVLPQMIQRARGAVVTVSSSAASIPIPLITVYAATEQYLSYFMRGLEYEYRSSGVTFQCLYPMCVATRMTQFSRTLSNPSLFIPTATTYARHALTTLGWTKHTPGYWPHCIQHSLVIIAASRERMARLSWPVLGTHCKLLVLTDVVDGTNARVAVDVARSETLHCATTSSATTT